MNANQIASNPLISGYAVGLPNRFRTDVTRHLCPRVPVGQSFQYVVYDENHKFDIPDTRRAEGSEGPFINEDAKLETGACEPRALNTTLDRRVRDASERVGIPIVQRALERVTQMKEREVHKRVVAAIDEHAASGGTITTASDDPVTFLDELIADFMVENRIEDPMDVRLTIGVKAFGLIKNSKAVLERRGGGGTKRGVSLMEFQEMLQFGSTAMLSTIIHQETKTLKDKTAQTVKRYWDDQITLTIGRDGMNQDDNSFIKQFYNEETWMMLRAWESGSGRFLSAGLDYDDKLIVTNPKAAKKITVKK